MKGIMGQKDGWSEWWRIALTHTRDLLHLLLSDHHVRHFLFSRDRCFTSNNGECSSCLDDSEKCWDVRVWQASKWTASVTKTKANGIGDVTLRNSSFLSSLSIESKFFYSFCFLQVNFIYNAREFCEVTILKEVPSFVNKTSLLKEM